MLFGGLLRFVHAGGTRLGENACSNCLAVEPTLSFAAKLRVEAPDEPSSGERKNSDCNNNRQAGFHAPMLPQVSEDGNLQWVGVRPKRLMS